MISFIQERMYFIRESDDVGDSSLQAWYSTSQHEGEGSPDWETEYYGESTGCDGSRPVEFVSEVEYRVETDEEEFAAAGRAVRSPSASD